MLAYRYGNHAPLDRHFGENGPVRLGLLVCDHVRPDLVRDHGDYEDMFRRLFAAQEEVEIVPYDVVGGVIPADPSECDAWITTGSRHSVNDEEPWIGELEEFVRRVAAAGTPFVGICFGHQMLAKALGGSVARAGSGWGVGSMEVAVREDIGLGPSFRLLNSHQDQVETLPPGAELLGGNEHCPVSMIRVGEAMVGIQGHPEFDPAYLTVLLQERRGSVIPAERADQGLRSLEQGTDSDRLARWMVELFRGGPPARRGGPG